MMLWFTYSCWSILHCEVWRKTNWEPPQGRYLESRVEWQGNTIQKETKPGCCYWGCFYIFSSYTEYYPLRAVENIQKRIWKSWHKERRKFINCSPLLYFWVLNKRLYLKGNFKLFLDCTSINLSLIFVSISLVWVSIMPRTRAEYFIYYSLPESLLIWPIFSLNSYHLFNPKYHMHLVEK